MEGFYGNAPARVPAARITYVPNEGASGEDSFIFVASDGDLRSEHEVPACAANSLSEERFISIPACAVSHTSPIFAPVLVSTGANTTGRRRAK